MDWKELLSTDGTTFVDGLTDNVNDSSKSLWANGNLNGVASIHDGLAAHKAFSGIESDSTHVVATQMLGDFENESVLNSFNFEGV